MIKAIIFDFFGVICSDDYWDGFKETKDGGGDFDKLSLQLNLGHKSWQDFIKELAVDKKMSVETIEVMFKSQSINPELVNFIGKLKKRYKTALLTNASSGRIKLMLEQNGVNRVFNEVVISSDYGLVKPDPKFFNVALSKLQVAPEEAIFIDDISRYVYAAQQMGMSAILYHDYGQMKAELARLLSPTSPNN